VLDTDGDGLLADGKMAETADLLLLVEPVGGHLHAAVSYVSKSSVASIRGVGG
jgi:hypothetical protein